MSFRDMVSHHLPRLKIPCSAQKKKRLGRILQKSNTPPGKPRKKKKRWHAWRIMPVSKGLITMVIVSPVTGVVGPLPNSRFMAYKMGVTVLTTYKSWPDPPSKSLMSQKSATAKPPLKIAPHGPPLKVEQSGEGFTSKQLYPKKSFIAKTSAKPCFLPKNHQDRSKRRKAQKMMHHRSLT